MFIEAIILANWLLAALWAVLKYIETRQWWTLRLMLSCLFPARSVLLFTALATTSLLWQLLSEFNVHTLPGRLILGSILSGYTVVFFGLLLPLVQSKEYVKLRYNAWTGFSRTGITPALTRYLGDEEDWLAMLNSCSSLSTHPVEKVLELILPFESGIRFDPTVILNARLADDEAAATVWVPRSEDKAGAYQPIEDDRSISLLWGKNLGFVPRCSRGIISVPSYLLSYQPRLQNGVDGRPLCLAHGILARNKGLEPRSLICNIRRKLSYRLFEENSVLWPRPAKTLRSIYQAEFTRSFAELGDSYITAATELALLLADADYLVIGDWLAHNMEHQDLSLNNIVASAGASVEDLERLYRGHYAAMLVSLSLHRPGIRIRPELTVYRAVCGAEGGDMQVQWLKTPSMVERLHLENQVLGARGMRLIEAIV